MTKKATLDSPLSTALHASYIPSNVGVSVIGRQVLTPWAN